jgi:signal transduction histidine kinase
VASRAKPGVSPAATLVVARLVAVASAALPVNGLSGPAPGLGGAGEPTLTLDPAPPGFLDLASFDPVVFWIAGAAFFVLIALPWWARQRRIVARRRILRSLDRLGEDLAAATSPVEILKYLASVLPAFAGDGRVHLYVYNRKTRSLDGIQGGAGPEPLLIPLDAPSSPLGKAAVAAFRNRTVVKIPPTRRISKFDATFNAGIPHSVMFVPMLVHGEPVGVMEVSHAFGLRGFSRDEQAAAQHFANQAAIWIRVLEQQSTREQLFRSEKLAAAGQLIAGIAGELRPPVESILAVSKRLLSQGGSPALEREFRMLAAEAERASEIVARLVSFGRTEESPPRPVDLNALLTNLIRFREREWTTLGVEPQTRLSPEPLLVLGSQGRIEQVLLDVLVHAEQSAVECSGKSIAIATRAAAGKGIVEITFRAGQSRLRSLLRQSETANSVASEVSAVQGVREGQMRFSLVDPESCRIEIEFPLMGEVSEAGACRERRCGRALTILVVEPDPSRRRALVKGLSQRDHRVVPVTGAEEALDLAQRFRFDVGFCSSNLPGISKDFVEFLDNALDVLVFTGDGFDASASLSQRTEGFWLRHPENEAELERALAGVEAALDSEASLPGKA